jgi:spore germination protein YaaH
LKKWQTREALGVLLLSLGLVSWAPSIHQLEQEKHRHISVVQYNPQTLELGRSEDVLAAHERYGKSVFVYLPYWSENFAVPWQKITHLAYFSLEIDAAGDITDSHGWESGFGAALVEAGHAAGVKIVLCVTLFSKPDIRTLLADPAKRANAISNMVEQVVDIGGDGLNIDFEMVPGALEGESPTPKENFVAFIQELKAALNEEISDNHLSIATPAVDWNGSYDFDELAEACDALTIMGYDYHWSGSSTTGPIAPIEAGTLWGSRDLTWTVENYIQYGGSENKDKFILGLPLYGRDWPTEDFTLPGVPVGSATTPIVSACDGFWDGNKLWDETSQTPYMLYSDGEQARQRFCEDSDSMAAKFDLILAYELGGVMFWTVSYVAANHELWDELDTRWRIDSEEPVEGEEENSAPTAHIDVVATHVGGEPLPLDGRLSADPDNDSLTYGWSVSGPVEVSVDDPTVALTQCVVEAPGIYQISLTVSDGLLSDTTSAEVEVVEDPDGTLTPEDLFDDDLAGCADCQSSPGTLWWVLFWPWLGRRRRTRTG